MGSMSDEEVDHQEQDPNSSGSAQGSRSYDCVFCKRGFNTAQALGGHMNVHRKNRTKNKPLPFSCCNPEEGRLSNQSTTSCSSYYFAHQTVHANFMAYFPPSMAFHQGHSPRGCSNPFGDVFPVRFSLPFEPPAVVQDRVKGRQDGGTSQEEDLDLELRLGL